MSTKENRTTFAIKYNGSAGVNAGRLFLYVRAVSRPSFTTPFFGGFGSICRIVFGQSIEENDRLDCPIGHCKLLIFRLLVFVSLLILLFIPEEVVL